MSHHEHYRVARLNLPATRAAIAEVEGFNAKVAVAITHGVGTMACAYLFGAIALVSLPAAIATGQTIVIVAWLAQTFLQLVLLSIIMVGQRVQSAAADTRAEQTFRNVEVVLDRLDTHTQGGLGDIFAELRRPW